MPPTIFEHLALGNWFVHAKGQDHNVYMKTNPVDGCFSCVNILTGRISPISWDTKVIYCDKPDIYLPDLDSKEC